MDNRKFDELMKKYVASTARDADLDLAKLRAEKASGNSKHPKRAWLKASAAILVILAVVLSLALPLTLQGKDGHDAEYFSFAGNLQFLHSSAEVVKNVCGSDIMLPQNRQAAYYLVYDEDLLAPIGMFSDCAPNGDYGVTKIFAFDKIHSIFYGKYSKRTELYNRTTEWRDLEVFYALNRNAASNRYIFYIIFDLDGFEYFIEIISYRETRIDLTLDYIFG